MSNLILRPLVFSPLNRVVLCKELENDYDKFKWIFDCQGNVTVLFPNWIHKDTIRQVTISKDPNGPSKELIELHNKIALERIKHYCPKCWKGLVNLNDHAMAVCEDIADDVKDFEDYVEKLKRCK